ncbi:CocE/NonD family hydrolase [Rhodococcus sp. IEGM 1307]|uniref:CocE/NonD family hydrolase n=1 Tax=Rhodococcus sp. IEGM 1307 TaxID=3047091 RepID=UPI0024B836A5|nr:CocE/NonD family hydrolase [Rhodococcus sp. IEGM 1307]MDI9975977.1 CocE/NonD family hydrolase [Rhodococcus sp. IEGM 1307]
MMSRIRWFLAGLIAVAVVAGLAVVVPRIGESGEIAADFAEYAPTPQFTERTTETFYVPMSDGTKLAVLLHRPAENGQAVDGRFPVIWHHKLDIYPSPKDGVGPKEAGYSNLTSMSDQGYVVAQVARRGNGQSFGVRRGYHDRVEAQDAYDVTEWLATQPWSNGQVGVYGCSNTGDAAMHAVSMRPPHLKAAFAGCFSWNKYDAMRRGGIAAQWGYGPTRKVEDDLALTPVSGDDDKTLLRQAAEQHQLSTPLAQMWAGMPYRDDYSTLVGSRFWAEGSLSTYADQIRESQVPLYIVGGWRDEFRDQGIVTALNTSGSKLLIGPWRHCENPGLALVQEAQRFFDFHLKGIDTGIDEAPPIRYAIVDSIDDPTGDIGWRTAESWPPTSSGLTDFALGGDGVLGSTAPGTSRFTVDTVVECPDAGEGSTVQPCHVPGAGASFVGAALEKDTEVTGTPIADVTVRVDRDDAHIFAYIEDVAPDGTVSVITEGRLTASLRAETEAPYELPAEVPFHRSYREDAQPLTPGEATRMRFDILPMSYVFRAGHRIQVTVTGYDHRETIPLPDAQGSTVEIVSDPSSPSLVQLPVAQS